MRLILVRHGESEGNAGRIFQGRRDFGLTAEGRRQAHRTAAALAGLGVHAVVSSPLSRARDTAAPIASELGLGVVLSDDLQEYDVGAISGLTVDEVRVGFPGLLESWRREGVRPPLPGEEGRDRFFERVSRFVSGMEWASDETVVAVTHGGVVNAACHVALGIAFPDFFARAVSFDAANCSLTEIHSDAAGRLVLTRHNDVCHLA